MTKDSPANRGFSLPFARIALVLAALVAVAAIALALTRSRSGHQESPSTAAGGTEPAGDVASRVDALERRLKENPNDFKGWAMLGWSYYNLGRYPEAVSAYSRATRIDPSNAEIWSALGEVQLLSGPGGVTPAAEASFRKALSIDPADHRARYFIAVKKDQDGNHKGAIDDWVALLKDSPPGAPWEQPVRALIAKVATANGIDLPDGIDVADGAQPPVEDSVATDGIPGPNAADLKAATGMTPAQQDEMARAMVARLAARLENNPQDADGWIRLMRARMVLNDPSGAQSALAKAKAAFKGNAGQIARFDEAAKTFGMDR